MKFLCWSFSQNKGSAKGFWPGLNEGSRRHFGGQFLSSFQGSTKFVPNDEKEFLSCLDFVSAGNGPWHKTCLYGETWVGNCFLVLSPDAHKIQVKFQEGGFWALLEGGGGSASLELLNGAGIFPKLGEPGFKYCKTLLFDGNLIRPLTPPTQPAKWWNSWNYAFEEHCFESERNSANTEQDPHKSFTARLGQLPAQASRWLCFVQISQM